MNIHLLFHVFPTFVRKTCTISGWQIYHIVDTLCAALQKDFIFHTNTGIRFKFKSTNDETITGNICEINSCMWSSKMVKKGGEYVDSQFFPTSDSDRGDNHSWSISIRGPPITRSTARGPQHPCCSGRMLYHTHMCLNIGLKRLTLKTCTMDSPIIQTLLTEIGFPVLSVQTQSMKEGIALAPIQIWSLQINSHWLG